jgi:L-lactate dehydrogenase
VIGLGTVLDTARFRSLIALETRPAAEPGEGADPRRARRQHGPHLEHGRGGRHPAGEAADVQRHRAGKLFERTKKSGAECISLKGGRGARSR